jgi:hypothetical protein
MEKIDRVIQAFRNLREDGAAAGGGMVANAPGTSGGFSGSANAKGPVAGFDPVMGMAKRKKGPQIKLPPGSRKRWKQE